MAQAAAGPAMTVKYDQYYKEGPDALGPPTKRLVDFLTQHLPKDASVLDVGCGQGRDAVWLARAGHPVTGIDPSSVGIAQLRDIAAKQSLPITAHVADLESFPLTETYDCVLFDRTLHMLDKADRIAGFKRLLSALNPAGSVVVLDEAPNLAGLRAVIPADWNQIWDGKSDFAYRRP